MSFGQAEKLIWQNYQTIGKSLNLNWKQRIFSSLFHFYNLHVEYIKQGSEARNLLMIKYCEEQILAAKQAYYNTEDPIMEDQVYDKIEDYLRVLDPNNSLLEKVGSH